MTPEQLKKACDVAGLETTLCHGSESQLTYWAVYLPHCGLCWIEADVVKSYVADLLMGKIKKAEWKQQERYVDSSEKHGCFFATDQRITAAMKALGHEGFNS